MNGGLVVAHSSYAESRMCRCIDQLCDRSSSFVAQPTAVAERINGWRHLQDPASRAMVVLVRRGCPAVIPGVSNPSSR